MAECREHPQSLQERHRGSWGGAWLNGPCKEFVLFSDQYDFTISLLHFDDAAAWSEPDEEPEEDAYDRMIRRKLGESWLA